MGIAERRTRHKASLRNEILDAARALFVEEGYDAVSMRKVAQRIEYSPTTIYLYFKDKGELFQAICEEMFAKLSRKLEEQAKKRAADPIAGSDRGAARRAADLREIRAEEPGALHRHVHAAAQPGRAVRGLDGAADLSITCGAASPPAWKRACSGRVDVEAAAQSLWAAVHGVVALLIAKCDRFPFIKADRLVDETIDTMIRGLRRQ